MASLVLFTAASQTFALPASCALRVLRMAALTPIPGAPKHVRGMLDIHGTLVPVVDVAARIGAPVRPPRPQDQLLVVEAGGRRVALLVERVHEIRDVTDESIAPYPEWIGPAPLAAGVARLPEGVVVLQSLEAWLASAP